MPARAPIVPPLSAAALPRATTLFHPVLRLLYRHRKPSPEAQPVILRPAALLLTTLLLGPPARAQTPTQPTVPTPTYDVVSIVPNKSDNGSSSWNSQDSTFTGTNLTAKMFVSFAFNLRQDLISGLPAWADSTHFDVNAKIIDPDLPALKKLTDAQHNLMLVQVLNDRFNLKFHTENKQLPVYNLVLAPHGSKLKSSAIQDQAKGTWTSNTGDFAGTTISIAALTDFLAGELHRTVIDQTSLAGFYDMHLKWAPDRPAGQDTGRPEDSGPSLFSALQDQLGLKLVPAKGPVTTLVVDHIDPPTPN